MALTPLVKWSLCILGGVFSGEVARHFASADYKTAAAFLASGIMSGLLYMLADPFRQGFKIKEAKSEMKKMDAKIAERRVEHAELEIEKFDTEAMLDWDARFHASLPADQKFRVHASPTSAQVDYEKAMMDYDVVHSQSKTKISRGGL